jgi:FMN phosphatase YigB (HAD superfamily)
MTNHSPVVFLLDVDDTLLDGDRLVDDLKGLLGQALGASRFRQYWAIFETLRVERDYVDYLGALQQYRAENPRDPNVVQLSIDLLEYPFSDRLFPTSLDVIKHLRSLGMTVIFSDGDAVFQAHKIQRSGLFDAVEGRVLVYVHKERDLDDIELRYPADHYVLVDDKPRVLGAVKDAWGSRVTTVCPRFGHYARDAQASALYTTPDITIASIGDLLHYDLPSLLAAGQPGTSRAEADFAPAGQQSDRKSEAIK